VTASAARYDTIGHGYIRHRRTDPRLSARLWAAVGDGRRIVNVGAGTGSYEDGAGARALVAVEPSSVMMRQRAGTRPVVQAEAEHLPFPDGAFDAALAILTVHHWADLALGLSELRRVARRQVVFGIDPDMHNRLWLIADYVPAIADLMATEPTLDEVVDGLNAHTVEVVPIPADCPDGFLMAYWRRPEKYLNEEVQASTSGFSRLQPAAYTEGLDRLRRDLASGRWQRRHADLLERDEFDVGLRLVIAG
jgi:SAM-dependent methyltransferase